MMNGHKYILKIFTALFLTFAAMTTCVAIPGQAFAQSVQLQPSSSEIYVDIPFELSIILTDFDETPQPEVLPFDIPDAEVRFVGISPRKSSFVKIVNGHRTSKVDVTFVFTYQITPRREGLFTIPIITAKQDSKEAQSLQKVTFTAASIQTTRDMRLVLTLPNKKIWVGQSFEVTLDWYLRKDVSGQKFKIPILNMPESFEVQDPKDSNYRSIDIDVGSRKISFPYERNTTMLDGLEYTRFRMYVTLTALRAGEIEIPASRVVADLETDVSRDVWGFSRSNYKAFRAEDTAKTLTIKELPQARRPASYTNAMGTEYKLQVKADRTILNAGDPIVLTIDISSNAPMDGVRLPLLTDAGLNDQLFGVPQEDPIGENIDGPNKSYIRRFEVPVRIKSDRVTEIPTLSFSYFNPVTEQYATAYSDPISLSVSSVDKVGVADVVSNQPVTKQAAVQGQEQQANAQVPAIDPSTSALNLGLMSSSKDIGALSISQYNRRPVRIALYILPFVIWGCVVLIRRRRKKHQAFATQKSAALALKKALKDAQTLDARTASSAIANALNAFLVSTESERGPFAEISQRMDDEAYRPNAESSKLPADLISDFEQVIKQHTNEKYSHLVRSIFAILLCIPMLLSMTGISEAQEAPAPNLQNDVKQIPTAVMTDPAAIHAAATETYHKAMDASDRADRIARFRQAAAQFDALSKQFPQSAPLYVDTGNAYLGAADFGHAALAYQRALALDPSIAQASSNLAYIQSLQGTNAANDSIIRSAFFLNNSITVDMRLFIAAICFFVAILLIIPWSTKNRRFMIFLSVIPFIGWIWMLAGALAQPKLDDTGIVIAESYLKTADNSGAANVSDNQVTPGISVTVIEDRNGWVQVKTADGQKGWMNASAVEYVIPRS